MTRARTNIMWVAIALLTLTAVASSAAAGEMRQLTLQPGSNGHGAKGEATMVDTDPITKEITIAAGGLKPNAFYTVWVVNMKPKMEMGGSG